MRHLITGGAGFIGYWVACALADRGDEVLLVDNLSRGRFDDELADLVQRDNVTFVERDLMAPDALDDLNGSFDHVLHFAAIVGVANVMKRPQDVLSVNAGTLLNVLDWYLKRCAGKFLFASTSEAYAWTMAVTDLPIPTPETVPLTVDDVRNQRATYSLSKVFGEMLVLHTCEAHQRQYAIPRFHNVYGPRMGVAHVIPEVFERVREGQDPLVVYNPDHRRAFCFVDDAVAACLAMLREDVASDVYNVGNQHAEYSIGEVAEMILELAGRPGARRVAGEASGPGIPRRCPDTSRLAERTGFRASVPLREGLQRTLRWYDGYFAKVPGS